MTVKDKKIRKLWLISYLIITLANLVYSQIIQREFYTLTGMYFWIPFIIMIITTPTILYLYYYCAYKKPGTKLLTFSLVVAPVFLILNVVLLLMGKISFAESGFNPLQLIPTIWLYVLTWKTRAINKKIQSASQGNT
jgi:hypothetical protein